MARAINQFMNYRFYLRFSTVETDRKEQAMDKLQALLNKTIIPKRLVTECSHIKALVVEQSIDWKGKPVRVVLPASFSATDRQQGERLSPQRRTPMSAVMMLRLRGDGSEIAVLHRGMYSGSSKSRYSAIKDSYIAMPIFFGIRRRSYTVVTKCKSHERASVKLILQCWRAIRRGARAWQAMSNALSTNASSQKTGRTHLGSDRLKDVARRLGASADTR